MTGKEKILIGFAFLTPFISASYFYTEIKRFPASLVKTCDAGIYEKERLQALGLVRQRIDAIKAGEDLPLLLPVEYIFTTGERKNSDSVLKINDTGETLIQTSDKVLTYVTDHRQARRDFMTGKKQYFSTVEVKNFKVSSEAVDYVTQFEFTGVLDFGRIVLAHINNPIAPHLKGVPFMKTIKSEDEMQKALARSYVGIPKMIDRFSCETFSSILTTSFRVTKGRELHAEVLNEP